MAISPSYFRAGNHSSSSLLDETPEQGFFLVIRISDE
jgi:hypothetical protein